MIHTSVKVVFYKLICKSQIDLVEFKWLIRILLDRHDHQTFLKLKYKSKGETSVDQI